MIIIAWLAVNEQQEISERLRFFLDVLRNDCEKKSGISHKICVTVKKENRVSWKYNHSSFTFFTDYQSSQVQKRQNLPLRYVSILTPSAVKLNNVFIYMQIQSFCTTFISLCCCQVEIPSAFKSISDLWFGGVPLVWWQAFLASLFGRKENFQTNQ